MHFEHEKTKLAFVHSYGITLFPTKHEQRPSIFRLLDQDFQMSHHSIYSAVLPFHVRGRGLV